MIPYDHEDKVNDAWDMVNAVLDSAMGFAYLLVKKIPLHTGREIRAMITRLKLERMSPNLHKDGTQLAVINDKLVDLRAKEKLHYHYEKTTRDELKKNYGKIRDALLTLQRNGEIDAFTLSPTGRFSITYLSDVDDLMVTDEVDHANHIYCDADKSVYPKSTAYEGIERTGHLNKYNPEKCKTFEPSGEKYNANYSTPRIKGEGSVSVHPGGGDMDRWYYRPRTDKPRGLFAKRDHAINLKLCGGE
jgi:hypothetical protein